MGVNDPHNLSAQLRNQKDKLDGLRQQDADLFWDFARLAEKDMEASTVVQYLSKLRILSEHADHSFADLSPREIDGILDDLQDARGWENGTRRNYEKAVRVLLRELRTADPDAFADHDRDYASMLPSRGAIRLTSRDEKKITPEDILTRNQITELIEDAARTARDRAMVAFLADTGVRIAGMLSLRVGDVTFRDEGGGYYRMNQEATGLKGDDGRKPVTWSAAHLETYLHGGEHPRPGDEAAPLIHKAEGWSDGDGSMTPALVRQRLKRLVKESEVEVDPDDISPHLFRHTAVSIWAKQGFNDREIKHRAGWSRESDMLDKYEHIEDDVINTQVLEKYGIDVESDGIGEPELDRCPRWVVLSLA